MAETDADRVVEGLNLIRESLDHLAQKLDALEVIADECSRLRDELKFLMNESAAVFRRLSRLPLDPTSIDWAARVAEIVPESDPSDGSSHAVSNESPSRQEGTAPIANKAGESPSVQSKPDLSSLSYAQCDCCDAELPVAEARKNGWIDLARWNGGGRAAYLGICDSCTGAEAPKAWEKATVCCTGCQTKVSAMEARDQKWKKIARFKEGGDGAFQGQCPCCPGGKPKVPKNAKTLFPTSE